jgi:predicted N-acyltransferase
MPKKFFHDISLNMPEETKYFLWKIDGNVVAFNLCLVKNGVLVDAYIGMDYNFAHKYHLYYLTFRDILVWCMENKIAVYEAGALNYDPKKRLDFDFIPQYIYARHINAIANFFFGGICALIKPENYDPLLKTLKINEKKHTTIT